MSEWKEIRTAPTGNYREVSMGNNKTRKVFEPLWVHTWRKDGHKTISYYLPEEGRWNGYTKESPPDMWHPYPDQPQSATEKRA